jgi:hypothetical protein
MKRQLLALVTLLLLLPAIAGAAWPTGSISATNLDADSDSPLLARPALKTTVDQVNAIRDNGEPLLKSTYTAADILTKVKTVDGAASGLDADLLDGVSSSGYVVASHLSVSNAVHGAYRGRVALDGLTAILPAGWSAVRTSTGRYTITHDVGANLSIVISAQGTQVIVQTYDYTATTFKVFIVEPVTMTNIDSMFSFIVYPN